MIVSELFILLTDFIVIFNIMLRSFLGLHSTKKI